MRGKCIECGPCHNDSDSDSGRIRAIVYDDIVGLRRALGHYMKRICSFFVSHLSLVCNPIVLALL